MIEESSKRMLFSIKKQEQKKNVKKWNGGDLGIAFVKKS